MNTNYDKVIFEVSQPGRVGYKLPDLDVPEAELSDLIPQELLCDTELDFPEVAEFEVIRHFTNLSNKNYSLDQGIYPLGSCTMKYNPKINEDMASLPGFQNVHPLQAEEDMQGVLRLMYELGDALAIITGMDKPTLQPAAGAHGEYTGILLIKAYHEKRGDTKRDKIIIPDAAHGTNPATAAMAGYKIIELKSTNQGMVDVEALRAAVGDDTAGLMLTNPNTVGMSDENIKLIADIVHEAGGLVYYDGANLNAIMGKARPGDMGFDVVHYNLHKTMSTPHGGGGPGSGAVACKEFLAEFLPVPVVEKKDDGTFYLNYDLPNSIGKVKDFYGHFGILVRAYTYILTMGADGLKRASEVAVLNANYLQALLKDYYKLPLDRITKHEVVFGGLKDPLSEVTTLDIAKRILDKGYHAPTVYFPLIINEAMMVEPTETETKQTLDDFANSLIEIAKEAKENPELLKEAPHNTPVRRPDETKAAKDVIVVYESTEEE